MQRRSIVTAVVFAAALPAVLAGPVLAQSETRTFTADLGGGAEVPAVETAAGGSAEFVLSEDGASLSFSVDVDGLEDTTMAHIHLAPAGENGPPVVWLHTQEQAPELVPGMFSGTLASGTITADDLVGPLEGATLEELLAETVAGNTYVNVHTEEFPDGEIRGQIAETAAMVEQPERIDAGAGGAATGSTGAGALTLGIGLVALLGAFALRRRVTA